MQTFLNNGLGLRISSDVGSEKLRNTGSNTHEDAKMTTKSNFTLRITPSIRDSKQRTYAGLGLVYKNLKTSMTKNILESEKSAEQKHHFGLGGHVGYNFHFNSKVALFGEISVDGMLSKDMEIKTKGLKNLQGSVIGKNEKFKTNFHVNAGYCIGIAIKLID